MLVVGLSLLAAYGLAALGLILLIEWVLAIRPSALQTLVVIGVLVVVLAYLSYRVGTARLLAGIDAVPIERERAPHLHASLDGLVERMDVARPALYVGDIGAPNALSLGAGADGAIVLDRRLLDLLTAAELEGILAHELAHAESFDSLVKTLAVSAAQSLVSVLWILLLPGVFLLTGMAHAVAWARGRPGGWRETLAGRSRRILEVFAVLVLSVLTLATLAHARKREFAADERAATVTGEPLALARALTKIDRAARTPWELFAPLSTHGRDDGPLRELLSTHPPVEERVDRLLALADARRGRIAG